MPIPIKKINGVVKVIKPNKYSDILTISAYDRSLYDTSSNTFKRKYMMLSGKKVMITASAFDVAIAKLICPKTYKSYCVKRARNLKQMELMQSTILELIESLDDDEYNGIKE